MTTIAVLTAAVFTEVRGHAQTVVGHRRVGNSVQRRALTITTLGFTVTFVGALAMMSMSGLPLREVLFEAVSAFGTVGLSMGITAALPHSAWAVLMILMFVGRVGTVSVAAALAMSERPRHYAVPKEDPLVG